MRRAITTLLCSFILVGTSAQNRLSELLEIKPCENIPCADKPLASWIDSVARLFFVSDLQYSNSVNGDGKFLSFSLLGRSDTLTIPLVHTPVKIVIGAPGRGRFGSTKTKPLSMEFRNDILAYTHGFNAATFTYELYDYYRLACAIYRINESELVSHTLGNFVDPDYISKENKLLLMLKEVKAKGYRVSLDASGYANLDSLVKQLTHASPDVYRLVYNVYLEGKDKKVTENKLHLFFARLTRNVVEEVNDRINVRLKLAFDEAVSLMLPAEWFGTNGRSAKFIRLPVQFVESVYNRPEHRLEVSFKITTSDSLEIIHGTNRYTNPVSGKITYSPSRKIKVMPEEIKLVVGIQETEIYVRAKDRNEIVLFKGKIKK